jgi:hypothetical protein
MFLLQKIPLRKMSSKKKIERSWPLNCQKPLSYVVCEKCLVQTPSYAYLCSKVVIPSKTFNS